MQDIINKISFLFGDNTKIFHKDTLQENTLTSQENTLKLQFDTEALEDWSNKWLLHFHPDKCHVLTQGKYHVYQTL